MTASSQTTSGALPPDSPYVRQPVPAPRPLQDALATAVADVPEQPAEADAATLEWFRVRLRAVGLLCEGRPEYHMLSVAEVQAAADGITTTAPLALAWTGIADIPSPGSTDERTVLQCVTAHGGRADLVLTPEERAALTPLLSAGDRDVHAPCPTPGCGTDQDLDATDPAALGWSHLQVAGTDTGPRWYCCPQCVQDALTRAGAEIAAADRTAAVDPGRQAADEESVSEQRRQLRALLARQQAAAEAETTDAAPAYEDDIARCVRCGCTEEQACQGGCTWVPNRQMIDLCSRCATPAELTAAAGGDAR